MYRSQRYYGLAPRNRAGAAARPFRDAHNYGSEELLMPSSSVGSIRLRPSDVWDPEIIGDRLKLCGHRDCRGAGKIKRP